MMNKRRFASISIVRQVALFMLTLSLLGIGGMSLSLWMAQSMQGNAHAINKAGSLRMQSYRLLSRVPLDSSSAPLLAEMEQDQLSNDLQQPVRRERLTAQYQAVREYWLSRLKPQLLQAQQPRDASVPVAEFVRQLDVLVYAIDQETEHRLALAALVLKVEIGLTLLVLLGTMLYLRRRLLQPWRRLLSLANAVAGGDFSQRYLLPTNTRWQGRHELDLLGHTLNNMSHSLSQTYAELEQRVAEKTADLQQKNRVLDYLYRASRQLHSHQPINRRLIPVLAELPAFIPLRAIQIKLYENDGDEQAGDPLMAAPAPSGDNTTSSASGDELQPMSWGLRDNLGNYGLVLAQYPKQRTFDEAQQRLMTTLMEQFTSTLALERQSEHQQQMLLMAERTAISAELHDSLAQSLSCLKMQISCLQMQSQETSESNKRLMQQMREELNTAYRQLRELLTTFRLSVAEPGLRAALKMAVDEFSNRLGFRVAFDYQLPAGTFTPHQVIHLLHIVREALNNIVKHAQATQASVTAASEQGQTILSICDNGCGLPEEHLRPQHYGLLIMQDRAASLPGDCQIRRRAAGGTEVKIIMRKAATAAQ